MKAWIAQLVEQWTEDPRVTSSNLVPGIKEKNKVFFYESRIIIYFNHLIKLELSED